MSTESTTRRTYEFGLKDRLRAAREEAGYGQREFEEATGLSRGSISNYERGKFVPRRPALAVWSLATGFDLAWLETGSAPARPKPDEGEWAHSDLNREPTGSAFSLVSLARAA